MELPKMKIFIYLLTFAAYSWSGYGSSVLANLRDAVLSAENIFGDVLGKVTDVFKALKHVRETVDASSDKECLWSCPNGVKPKQNKYYKPSGNGCGPQGLEISADTMPQGEMTNCCNEHDICYGTCNKDKRKCDSEFKKCLNRICDYVKSSSEMGCRAAAKMLEMATSTFGCKYYQDAQQEACFCGKKKYEL